MRAHIFGISDFRGFESSLDWWRKSLAIKAAFNIVSPWAGCIELWFKGARSIKNIINITRFKTHYIFLIHLWCMQYMLILDIWNCSMRIFCQSWWRYLWFCYYYSCTWLNCLIRSFMLVNSSNYINIVYTIKGRWFQCSFCSVKYWFNRSH